MKQHPFSLYDFLGYFTPGAFVLYLIFLISILKDPSCTLKDAFMMIPSLSIEGLIFMLIVSYSIGHIISYVSSITVEKYSIWQYGYPSRFLLNIKVPRFRDHLKTFVGIFWGLLIIILLLPTVILDFIFGRLFGLKAFYARCLDDELIKIISLKINQLAQRIGITKENGFGENGAKDCDYFRIIQHYTYDYSKNHQSKFSNYISIYGFLRTMTLIFNLLFWYILIHIGVFHKFDLNSILILSVTSIVAYTFFMGFVKFYRRYTLEGFMVLVIDCDLHDKTDTKN